MLKNLLDACGAAIAYYICGFAFSFGGTSDRKTFIGNANFFLQGDFDRATFFFHSAMSASAVTSKWGTGDRWAIPSCSCVLTQLSLARWQKDVP